MPITKSAKKALRVSLRRQKENRSQEIDLEKALKKASASNINEVISKIDKAAKTGLIHKNKAARMKSRLMKKFGTKKSQSSKLKVQNDNVKSKMKSLPKSKAKK